MFGLELACLDRSPCSKEETCVRLGELREGARSTHLSHSGKRQWHRADAEKEKVYSRRRAQPLQFISSSHWEV